MLVTPMQAPNASVSAERWIRTVRAECLDWLLIVGRGHLEQVLRVYVEHYNRHRAYRTLQLQAPDPATGLTSWMRVEKAAFIDETCSVACSTNTGELHECVCAPFALTGGHPFGLRSQAGWRIKNGFPCHPIARWMALDHPLPGSG